MDADFRRFTQKPTHLCVKGYISEEPRLLGVLTEDLTRSGVQEELCWVLKDEQEFTRVAVWGGKAYGRREQGAGQEGVWTAAQRVGRGPDQAAKSHGTSLKGFRQGAEVERDPDVPRFAFLKGRCAENGLEETRSPSGGRCSGPGLRGWGLGQAGGREVETHRGIQQSFPR